MSLCDAPMRVPIFGATVPQPWAWSVGVRNAPVLNLHRAPSADVLGAYVAVCAAAEYVSELAEWMASWHGPGVAAPRAGEVPTSAVVAVARVAAVSLWPDAERQSRWYVGPAGLWLEDVVELAEPIACEPGPADVLWEMPAPVLARVRLSFGSAAQADRARWTAYEARAARAGGREPSSLRERVLRMCTCRRAMTLCRTCRAWRCTAPGCPPHTCAEGVSP
ncbi:hypothetical protein COCOR_04045 [Corallococcus coralloides DSM 2259]|uniref:Uncharacterized protein n=1 Tax=Corallococcus coralloides (strain ATCC 25202 / DSM 2259 / NBRC 100086 / M2) TaxID=1144275 RepID=H8MVR4_CORCM|nr:hypothetical protein [Corallococcus coralloides]AFE05594.1 hypothetical protein COCOR_04045 [Corallococcus coralloides DSM 2259]